MAKLSNPFGFTPGPVTFFITITYFAIVTILILIQTGPPSLPDSSTPIHGVNLTEAWNDLQVLSAQHHPYNSRNNDHVHDWLVSRINAILHENKASSSDAYLFEDNKSNLTFSSGAISVYFESTNIIVYIRGKQDDGSEWWKQGRRPTDRNGVLVNAHYDSVSSGFGATDDGVGVVSVLQLVRYYTTPGNTPKNGLVLLLNNGEEDYLNGANVFSQHPMANFVSSFLNLEGAGAGGRAALFRSTDEEVTRAYGKSPYPFGTVISGDAFNRGLVRSQTDYVVFNGILGLRGLDVAFVEPRARYHTAQDDSRHTGKDAIWHMLSAAVATTKELTRTSPRIDTDSLETLESQVNVLASKDPRHPAVWFDLFGLAFLVMRTHTFFALSIALLVVGPILLLSTLVLLYRADKLYMFSNSRSYHSLEGDESVPLYGWRGYFRFPLILLVSCAAPVALAYLVFTQNEFIAHSSEWAVWSMMIASFLFVAWFCCRVIDFARPSALARAYGLTWLCAGWWVFLVVGIVFEEQFHLAGGYPALFFSTSLFLATWLSYLELFSLPRKSKYCAFKLGESDSASVSRAASRHGRTTSDQNEETEETTANTAEEEEPNESSSLLRTRGRSVYKTYSRSADVIEGVHSVLPSDKFSTSEQEWSKSMWSGLWFVEFLLLGPVNTIILGQLGLYMVAALHQTGADGSSMFIVYVGMAVVTIFMLSPTIPFLHRFTWQIPTFLFLVLAGTLVYNLLAFPFSSENRLKLFFHQEIDLNKGYNRVSVVGVDHFVQKALSSIPSTAEQTLDCVDADIFSGRQNCYYTGPAPQVAAGKYKTWANYNVSVLDSGSDWRSARFVISGQNTRNCKLVFNSSISDFHVAGQGPLDKRFPSLPADGTKEIRFWSRSWNRPWQVDVRWEFADKNQSKLTGKVVCNWADANQHGVIPAFDELKHYLPEWAAVTKSGDGLVEGYKTFSV